MTTPYKVAFAVLALLNVVWGILWATQPVRSPANLGVCVNYYTAQTADGTVTVVSQVGSPIKTEGTQSCIAGSFVPVVAQ